MLIPAATDLGMTLELIPGARVTGTWGYDAQVSGNRVTYYQHTIHNRDYETILVKVFLPRQLTSGTREIGRFSLTYDTVSGDTVGPKSYPITTVFETFEPGLVGVSQPTVLQAHTALRAAEGLKEIGVLNQSIPGDNFEVQALNQVGWQNREVARDEMKQDLIDEERRELQSAVRFKRQRCIDVSLEMKKEIRYVRMLLGTDVLESERTIFEKYVPLFAGQAGVSQPAIDALNADAVLRPMAEDALLSDRLESFTHELTSRLGESQSVMYGAFREATDEPTSFGRHVARVVRQGLSGPRVLTPGSDFLDPLSAAYAEGADAAVYGAIIDMGESVAIFGKHVAVPSGELISIAYTILPRTGAAASMLPPLE
jgi:hypothetical protein